MKGRAGKPVDPPLVLEAAESLNGGAEVFGSYPRPRPEIG